MGQVKSSLLPVMYSLQAKNFLFILKQWKKKKTLSWQLNLHETQTSVFIGKVLLEHNYIPSAIFCV